MEIVDQAHEIAEMNLDTPEFSPPRSPPSFLAAETPPHKEMRERSTWIGTAESSFEMNSFVWESLVLDWKIILTRFVNTFRRSSYTWRKS